jgi:hypothetical protein
VSTSIRSQRTRGIIALAVVVLLTAVALTPLLRADQPCTHDGGLHYFRIVAMRHALDDGLLVSRWIPDLAFGYGYPFFNYRAAVSYYLGLALYLTGLALPQALNLVYVLSLLASAIGAYLLGRDLFGRRAGVVAAVVYVYAPYPLLDALVRGNMPESVALAILPFILWAFRRLLLIGQARYLLLSAAALALLWLSHNISSLLFTPYLALYVLVVWGSRRRRAHLAATGVALALGIGLTAFFWAPALLEQDEVQLHLSRTTRNNDYHYNFVNLTEILAPAQPADTALLNSPLRVPLGLPLALLAGLGTLLALWRWRAALRRTRDGPEDDAPALLDRERWFSVVFFALSGVALLFMSTRASLVLWENLPLIPFVQFPWRFVGRAVLPFSLLAAALVAALPPTPQNPARHTEYPTSSTQPSGRPPKGGAPYLISGFTLLTLTLLILTALPSLYPPTGYCPAEPRPDMLDVFAYERSTGLVGVDPEGSYFPVTVLSRPAGSPLEAQYAAQLSAPDRADRMPIARFDAASLPPGAVIHHAEYTPNRASLEVETPVAVRARYFAFAFPGWRVLIDDRAVEIIPSDPEGLITFDLLAGRHVVLVDWGGTPVRAVATMLSLVALAAVAFVAYTATRDHLARRIRANAQAGPGPPLIPGRPFSWGQLGSVALLGLLLLAFKLLVVDRADTLFRRPGLSADGTLPGVDVPLDVRYEDGVRLLGYDRSTETMPADGTLHLAFYWSAYARPSRSYKATVALLGPDGGLWSPKTAFPRRGYADLPPSPAWGAGRYAVDGLDVEPLPGTPPGPYDLLLTAFDRETLAPLNVLDDAGQVAAPNLAVGRVQLTRPSRPPDPADVPVQTRLGVELGPLTLWGVNLDRDAAAPGDPMLVTLFWGVENGELPDLQAHLALEGEDGTEAMVWELPPVRDDWPTTLWRPGDLWRGQHLLRLPARLDSGDYVWRLSLYESSTPGYYLPASPVELGRLRVDAPQRLWEAPPLEIPLDAELGGQVALFGADLAPAPAESLRPPAALTVTLAWQALAEMDVSYRVFLHLLQPDGSLLVQSDGEPANWTRPTTGWAPGEVILDQRTLEIPADAPPGQYTLVAGLYDPDTRQRLSLPDGTDAVPITPIALEAP